MAGLEPMPSGRTFHGYRSKFASETKHLSDKDRARVGGWRSPETLTRVYDDADAESMFEFISKRRILREKA